MGTASRPQGGPNIIGDRAGKAFRAKCKSEGAGSSAVGKAVLKDSKLKEKARKGAEKDKDKDEDKDKEEDSGPQAAVPQLCSATTAGA